MQSEKFESVGGFSPVVQPIEKQISELLYEANSKGYPLTEIIPDGRLRRFKMDSNDSKMSGTYRAHHTGLGLTLELSSFNANLGLKPVCLAFTEDGKELSEDERNERQDLLDRISKKETQRKTLQQESRRVESQSRWNAARDCEDHSLLRQRRIDRSYGAREDWAGLLVPMRDFSGELWNVEIHRPGSKGIVSKGSRKAGLFHLIGDVKNGTEHPLYICESFTTAASLYQLLGCSAPVACAFSAGNMPTIAKGFREKFPNLEIIISGDRDPAGRRYSQSAARLSKGKVFIPDFGFDHPEYTDWNDFYKLEERGVQMAVTEIQNFKAKKKSQAPAAAEFQEWFTGWAEVSELDMDYRGEFSLGKDRVSHDFVESRLFLEANSVSKSFGKNHCKSALSIWSEEKKNALKKEIIDPLFQVGGSNEIERFIQALTGKQDPVHIAILKHFIWQVKRKMKGIPVVDHIMPVVTGPQRSGKTQAIAKLSAPLKELVGFKSVSSLTQDNQYPMFESCYVIVCDEMARSAQADMDSLKGIITSSHLQTKKYYAQTQLHIRNNCTLIGSSNYTLDALLKDPTGMRRFYEIGTAQVCDWDQINSIDYLELWRSIDPAAPCFISPYFEAIGEAQEELREPSDVEEFIEDSGILADEEGKVLIKELWSKHYIPWAEKNGVKYPKRPIPFGIEMKRLGYKNVRSHGKRFLKIQLQSQSGAE